jgi:hypothetical protein
MEITGTDINCPSRHCSQSNLTHQHTEKQYGRITNFMSNTQRSRQISEFLKFRKNSKHLQVSKMYLKVSIIRPRLATTTSTPRNSITYVAPLKTEVGSVAQLDHRQKGATEPKSTPTRRGSAMDSASTPEQHPRRHGSDRQRSDANTSWKKVLTLILFGASPLFVVEPRLHSFGAKNRILTHKEPGPVITCGASATIYRGAYARYYQHPQCYGSHSPGSLSFLTTQSLGLHRHTIIR